jgi:hypothetical protein
MIMNLTEEPIMKRLTIRAYVVLLLSLLCTTSGQVTMHDPYCWDAFDEFREIQYWAKRHVSVGNYNSGSGDAEYLKLCSKDPDPNSILDTITHKGIVDYFNSEFKRLFMETLPFHDAEKGEIERMMKMLETQHGQKDDFLEIFDAIEEARRNALYGPNPGAVSCEIGISRREFPVLYEMKTTLTTKKDPSMLGGMLEEKKLGYSTPEYIVAELKRSITQQLEALQKTLKIINDCDNKRGTE